MKKFNMIDEDFICSNCGYEVKDSDYICPRCGMRISDGKFTNVQEVGNNSYQPKSKVIAVILAFLLGTFGIHNFYLGYTNKGLIQLLITLISCFTLSFISEIWAIVEAVMLLTGNINKDGKGNPIGD